MAHRLAQSLNPDERDAFLGDQAELGKSGLRAAYEACGLVIRRQLQASPGDILWWFIIPFFGVSVSQSIKLGRMLVRDSLLSFLNPNNLFTCLAVIIVILSWSSGHVIGSLSGRAIRRNSAVLVAVWLVYLVGLTIRYELTASVFLVHGLMCLLPFVAGVRSGGKNRTVSTALATVLTAVPPLIIVWLIATAQRGSGGDGSIWPTRIFVGMTLLFVASPGALLLVLSRQPRGLDPSPGHEAAP